MVLWGEVYSLPLFICTSAYFYVFTLVQNSISADPLSVDLHIDGTTDKCTKGEDINFVFTGFTMFGKVKLMIENFWQDLPLGNKFSDVSVEVWRFCANSCGRRVQFKCFIFVFWKDLTDCLTFYFFQKLRDDCSVLFINSFH